LFDLVLKSSEHKYLEFTIKDADLNYVDLNGCDVTLQVQKYGSSSLSINAPCEIVDPDHGKVRYLYEGELSPGYYKAEIEISNSNTKLITKTFIIKVEEEIS